MSALALEGTLPVHSRVLEVRTLALEVVSGSDEGKHHRTEQEKVSVGTAPTNDLVLTDETVSRYHLDLERRPAGILLVDHGSTNRSIVNGIAVNSGIIPPGSKIRLGRSVLAVNEGDQFEIEVHDRTRLGGLIGQTDCIRKLMTSIVKAARSDTSILVLGETGAGKEVVARALHDHSSRAGRLFEVVDCGAVLPTLLASELFGHEKGAFTGADRQHIGAFERADGGTLFLDEIGELPVTLQSALLGALERRSFLRLGGRVPISVDVRVICATNRDLRRDVNAGTFRQDLYYRIAVVLLAMPPLRERLEDIPLLVEHFLSLNGQSTSIEQILTPKVLERFNAHHWPGNVRELRNTIEASIVMGEPPNPPESLQPFDERASISLAELADRPYNDARADLLERFERTYVEAILARNGGNISSAARDAQVHRSCLTKILRRHGLQIRRVAADRDD